MLYDAKWVKERYPVGTRVILDYMNDEHPVPCGTRGVVRYVDDMGTIHVDWENGSSLGLICDEDKFSVI